MPPKRKLPSKSEETKSKNAKTGREIKTTKRSKGATGKAATAGSYSLMLKTHLTHPQWEKLLAEEFDKDYLKNLEKQLAADYRDGKEIFPPNALIFNAFNLTPLDKVKVIILGQDPYHDNGQAMGLSFSVPRGIAVPPSLKNIYKELVADPKIPGFKTPDHGCLVSWAEQGVLLLNATLTVEAHKANSHAKYGWQTFTDNVIKAISEHCDHVVFILWGGFAHKKEKLVDQKKHKIVKTAHPSPLSFGKFINCGCFSDCNAALKQLKLKPIDWTL